MTEVFKPGSIRWNDVEVLNKSKVYWLQDECRAYAAFQGVYNLFQGTAALQAFIDGTSHPQYQSVASSAQAIVHSQGYQGLWLGLAPRAFRLVGATFILNKVRTGIIDFVEHERAAGNT